MIQKIFITSILTVCCLCIKGQDDKKVAVFDPVGDVESAVKEIVREETSSNVVNNAGYTVLERQLINKVLEENKFQMAGLVDEAQISEIGKRIGANYVFVTTISPLGKNFYISCKMIEVLTARIEKQQTSSTQDGVNDIVETTQFIVNTMFGKAVPPLAKKGAETNRQTQPVQAAKQQEQTAKSAETKSATILVARGMDIYSQGKQLSRREIQTLMANTESLSYYNKGISRRRKGNTLFTIGLISFSVGFICIGSADDDDVAVAVGAIGMPMGLALAIPGLAMKKSGKRYVRRSADVFNNGKNTASTDMKLDFGITQSGGVGLVLTF